MRIKNRNLLILLLVLSLVVIPLVFLTQGVARIAASVLVLVFCPGYVLIAALFPRQNDITLSQRCALSFGLSIAVVSGLGLLLHFTGIGVSLNSILFTTVIWIVLFFSIGIYRNNATPEIERVVFETNWPYPERSRLLTPDKWLYALAGVVLITLAGTLVIVAFTPTRGEQYTEFYILDNAGQTVNFPAIIENGESVRVTVGVIHRSDEPAVYRLAVNLGNQKLYETGTGRLSRDEKWESLITLIPAETGNGQRIEFRLYQEGREQPCFPDPLYLNVDILPQLK